MGHRGSDRVALLALLALHGGCMEATGCRPGLRAEENADPTRESTDVLGRVVEVVGVHSDAGSDVLHEASRKEYESPELRVFRETTGRELTRLTPDAERCARLASQAMRVRFEIDFEGGQLRVRSTTCPPGQERACACLRRVVERFRYPPEARRAHWDHLSLLLDPDAGQD